MRCDECRFWDCLLDCDEAVAERECNVNDAGRCHRYPSHPTEDSSSPSAHEHIVVWASDWCGEFQANVDHKKLGESDVEAVCYAKTSLWLRSHGFASKLQAEVLRLLRCGIAVDVVVEIVAGNADCKKKREAIAENAQTVIDAYKIDPIT